MHTVQGRPARIVVVSSALHKDGAINLQDLHYRHRKYDPWGSYGKLHWPNKWNSSALVGV